MASWFRVSAALVLTLAIGVTVASAATSVAQASDLDFFERNPSARDPKAVEIYQTCGRFWPSTGQIETLDGQQTGLTGSRFTVSFKFKLTSQQLVALGCLDKLPYLAHYLEIDFRLFGFKVPDAWDDYTVTTNLPGGVHDVAYGDSSSQVTPGVTGILVRELKANVMYEAGIAWDAPLDAKVPPSVAVQWVPSYWAKSPEELAACARGLKRPEWCIFPKARAFLSYGYFGEPLPIDGYRIFTFSPSGAQPSFQPAPPPRATGMPTPVAEPSPLQPTTPPVAAPPAQPVPSVYNPPANANLFFVKKNDLPSGRVEVHSATVASGYGSGVHKTTYFTAADGQNGDFQMVGSDLWYIKKRNTGSGKVEVHSATAASGYSSGEHLETWFSTVDQGNGWFQMVGSDLFFIKTRSTTSGKVEVHSATKASNYQNGQHDITWFGTDDQNNGWFQIRGSDLFLVKTSNTGAGKVDIHSATRSSSYTKGIHVESWFTVADRSNGYFQMMGGDLYFIKTRGTPSNRVEVHSALARLNYKDGQHSTTWLTTADQNNGPFQVGDK